MIPAEVAKYPDLASQLRADLSRRTGCGDCDRSELIRRYSEIAQSRDKQKGLALPQRKR